MPARVSTYALVQRRLTVRGCLIYDHPTGFADAIATLRDADLRPGRVLRERYELDDAPKAFDRAAEIAGKTWITLPRDEETAR
jgi:alcohol dehydrogenase/L-iditol 2-dehydrogenase